MIEYIVVFFTALLAIWLAGDALRRFCASEPEALKPPPEKERNER